jgi:hypothetical protein
MRGVHRGHEDGGGGAPVKCAGVARDDLCEQSPQWGPVGWGGEGTSQQCHPSDEERPLGSGDVRVDHLQQAMVSSRWPGQERLGRAGVGPQATLPAGRSGGLSARMQ